jgi:DnaK suppressor protein
MRIMEPELMHAEKPTDDHFLNQRQRDYFRQKLLAWKNDLFKEANATLQFLQDDNQNHPDFMDRASSETDRAIELRARDRARKLIVKIDAALRRIEDGTYGYCEETGEPISIKRLEAFEARNAGSASIDFTATSKQMRSRGPRTTKLYDRTKERLTQDEIERIVM